MAAERAAVNAQHLSQEDCRQGFWIALQFLTIVPVHLRAMPSAAAQGVSLAWYPVIGLLIGLLLAAAAWLAGGLWPAPVAAALVLAVWVILTGALHIDGLADTADGWLGGFGDRERTLAIMKDPSAGPAAVTAVGLLLLLKLVCLATLLAQSAGLGIIAATVAGRAAMPVLLLGLPLARAQGLASAVTAAAPRALCYRSAALGAAFAVAIAIWAVGWLAALVALLMSVLALLWWRRQLRRRLGGTTGDTAGAALEVTETLVLIGMCLS